MWPIVGYGLFTLAQATPSGLLGRQGWSFWALSIVVLAGSAYAGYVNNLQLTSPGTERPGAGLEWWAAIIGSLGLFSLAFGLLYGRPRWNNINTALGLDIVGVMGAALGIGWLMLA